MLAFAHLQNSCMNRLCRLCLEQGAELPIFENVKHHSSELHTIKMKLTTCLQEEVEEVKGYPTNICHECNSTLDLIVNFKSRYIESCHILENRLKEMGRMQSGDGCMGREETGESSESELTLAKVKLEMKLDLDQEVDHMEIFGHLVKEEIKGLKKTKRKEKKEKKIKSIKMKGRNSSRGRIRGQGRGRRERNQAVSTGSIASSLLEGVFVWSDDRWSYSNEVGTSEALPAAEGRAEHVRALHSAAAARARSQRRRAERGGAERLCDLCGAVFASQSKLTSHRRSHAAATLACPAAGCSKLCNSQYNLARHHARRHGASSERRYSCAACGKRFAFRAELTHHSKQHNRSRYPRKTYACSHCDKTYKTRQSVEIHERSAHTGERPARCEECGAAFFHETYLREHVRLHTGETPYACPVCARGYAQRANMKSHLRSHRLADLDARTRAHIPPNYLKLLKI